MWQRIIISTCSNYSNHLISAESPACLLLLYDIKINTRKKKAYVEFAHNLQNLIQTTVVEDISQRLLILLLLLLTRINGDNLVISTDLRTLGTIFDVYKLQLILSIRRITCLFAIAIYEIKKYLT